MKKDACISIPDIRKDLCLSAFDARTTGFSALESVVTSTDLSRFSRLNPKGLVDGLSQFFTPSNKRNSRVSNNAVRSTVEISSSTKGCHVPIMLSLRVDEKQSWQRFQSTGHSRQSLTGQSGDLGQ